MSNHFNLKSLAFYGAAIAFVVVLFSVTTSYGEAHVKAPAILMAIIQLMAMTCQDASNPIA